MSFVKRQLEAEHPHIPTRMWYGFFAEDVIDISDRATIIIPDYDPRKKWGNARWQSGAVTSDDPTLLEDVGDVLLEDDTLMLMEASGGGGRPLTPHKGDECLVILDNRNNPWVASWWPY
jgi:hypothetical protein